MASFEHSLSAGSGSPAAAPAASRGRGAVTNVPHRFQQSEREGIDDGWHGDALDAASHSATDALPGEPVPDFLDDAAYPAADDSVELQLSEPVPDYDLAVDDDFSDLDLDPHAGGRDVIGDDFAAADRGARRAERQAASSASRPGFWDRVPADRALAAKGRGRAMAFGASATPSRGKLDPLGATDFSDFPDATDSQDARWPDTAVDRAADAEADSSASVPVPPSRASVSTRERSQPQPQARAALEQRASRTTVVYPVAYPPVPPSLKPVAMQASLQASPFGPSSLDTDPPSHAGMPPYTGDDAGAARALTAALQAAARAASEASGADPNEAPVVFFPRRAFSAGVEAGGAPGDGRDAMRGVQVPGARGGEHADRAAQVAARMASEGAVASNRPGILPTGGALKTTVKAEQARKLLSRNDSPDIPFDQAVNPYRGCEHGCVYCYARPTHAYLGYSPGLDFETRLIAKANAVEALRAELAKPGYKVSPINIGSATDVYQPIERTWKLTRGLLQLMDETGHPATLVTKNALVERDIDVLQRLAERKLITVYMSITTLDSAMSRTLEPRASAPWRRIQTVRTLARAGIPVSVNVAPVIPFINDDALEQILEQAAAAGARSASYTVVRLPWEVKDVFEAWLRTHFPDRAQRVLHRIEDMRNGRLNDPEFGTRMRGTGVWADLIKQRFQVAMRRLSFRAERPVLSCEHFVPPQQAPRVSRREMAEQARREGQMDLF